MKTVALGEVVDLRAGVGFPPRLQGRSDGDYPIAKVGDISRASRSGSPTISTTDHFVVAADLSILKMKPVPTGSVLFAKIGEAIRHNHRVIAGRPLLIDNNAMAAVPNSPNLNSQYLYRFLQVVDLYALASSTTVPSLRKSDLECIRMPLPPLDEQRRIAAILDQADALRAKRRRVVSHLDSLTQAMFHDMFGSAPGEVYQLGDVAEFFGGSSLPEGEPFEGQQDGILLMKVSDMNAPGNEDEIMGTARWANGDGARSSTVPMGAVVLPKRGAAIATNKKRLTTRRTSLDPNIMGILPRDGSLVSRYLYEWFKSFDLVSITSGSTVPQLNKQDLAPLPIAVPSMDRQLLFAERIKVLNERRLTMRRIIDAFESLFASLQSRAFRGEL